ncbi:GntR family transcriptional regulator [Kordiimonas pumila]|uniref:GntR family transcriptional regulator n=1 Tax=Kordiimonas pumila TaxID=2161677 RepID=A0ABV7D4G5_9PROT|nr:GntR family transcriptional regulator [Kordiimonas pumila]
MPKDEIVNSEIHNPDVHDAYEQIMDAIVTQKLAPSQKVSENVFSDMFGISRSISRNLIERLTAKHFLVSMSPRVTLVAPLTLLEIKQNFTLRKILLPEIFALGAQNVDYEALNTLNKQISSMMPIKDDASALQVLKTNKQLNMLLCENAGYPLMQDWAQQLEDTAMRIYWLYVKVNKTFFYSKEQVEMSFSVMKNEEPARVRKVMYDILSQTEERILNTVFSHEQFYTQDLKV